MEEKIILRRLQLSKEEITIESTTKITVEISYGNEMHSLVGGCRKFIFSIEQIDEESSPLQEGEQYTFSGSWVQGEKYLLVCMNYPNIKCLIRVSKKLEGEGRVPSLVSKELMEVKEEDVKSEQKQKEESEKEIIDGSPFGECSPQRPDYEQMLGGRQEDTLSNKYLRYFQQQFKLWRDFFEEDEVKSQEGGKSCKEQINSSEKGSKEGPSSCQGDKNKERSCQGEDSKEDTLSLLSPVAKSEGKHKVVNLPDISNSCSYQESKFTEQVHSYSQKNLGLLEETEQSLDNLRQKTATVSQTSGKYALTPDNGKGALSIQKTKQGFIDWAIDWSNSTRESRRRIGSTNHCDKHLVAQWFTYLHNKFKISEFMNT